MYDFDLASNLEAVLENAVAKRVFSGEYAIVLAMEYMFKGVFAEEHVKRIMEFVKPWENAQGNG